MSIVQSGLSEPLTYKNAVTGFDDVPSGVPCLLTVGPYEVRLAETRAELNATVKLRQDVFFGYRDENDRPGLEKRDETAHHLIVIEKLSDGCQKIVGNLRLINSLYKDSAENFYSDEYYDYSALLDRYGRANEPHIELGRFCIAEGLRHGKILMLLWKSATLYLKHFDPSMMFGISSFSGTDLSVHLPALTMLRETRLVEDGFMPTAKLDAASLYDIPAAKIEGQAEVPTLVKGYLKMGARISDTYYIDHLYQTIFVFLYVTKQGFLEYFEK